MKNDLIKNMNLNGKIIDLIFDKITEGVIITDCNEKITLFNKAAEIITSWKQRDALNKKIETVFKISDTDSLKPISISYKKVLESNFPINSAEKVILSSKNGDIMNIIYSVVILNEKKDVNIGLLLTFRDISDFYTPKTDLKKIKNYLNDIINSMPSILIGIDEKGFISHWNKEAENILCVPQKEVVGKYFYEVIPYLNSEIKDIRKALKNKKLLKLKNLIHYESGDIRFSDVIIYPLKTDNYRGFIIRIDDVTTRVRLEKMMVQTEKMLSVSSLAAGMAHEINNPLSGILHGTQNILRRISPEHEANKLDAKKYGIDLENTFKYLENREIIKFLNGIIKSGERVSSIVSNMLNFSTSENKNYKEEDLKLLIDKTINLASFDYNLKNKINFNHIEIFKNYDQDVPPVLCIKSEISQVVLNILKNAAESFIGKKIDDLEKPRIIIRLKRCNDKVKIEFDDNGKGMDESIRNRIFEPFFTTKKISSKTGLGLSVSYFIITNNHGGEIKVESIPEKGSKFTIILPVKYTI